MLCLNHIYKGSKQGAYNIEKIKGNFSAKYKNIQEIFLSKIDPWDLQGLTTDKIR